MRYTLHLSIVLALLVIVPCRAFSLEVPQLKARVNDYAGILSPAMTQKLEGDVIEDFSIRVAEKWKIGQKGKDNGIILLIARDDRKVRIEVGRGLEGKVTDLVSGRIIRNSIIPYFKSGDYDNGVWAGTADIINVVKGEYVATDADAGKNEKGFGFKPDIFILIIIFAGPIIGLVAFLSRKSKILGGIAGGGVASAVAYLGFLGISLIGLGIFGVVGFLIGVLLGSMKGSGGSSWGGYSGSSFGGGGFGGGGGGFSGGGGSFGGGGSSGSW